VLKLISNFGKFLTSLISVADNFQNLAADGIDVFAKILI
jgi:hypothetical protein